MFAQERINLNRIGLYTMNIGEIEVIVISDGHLCVNPVQVEFAQHIDSSEVARTLQKHFAPGHTPGHTIIRIYSENEELYHIADIVHSQIISFEHPEWIYNSDTDYNEGIKTRQNALERLSNSGSLFFAYHLP